MLPGPVFNVELLTTARRARYYFARVVYGLILLYLLWQTYQSTFWWRFQPGRKMSIAELSAFANGMFMTILAAELVGVLVLTPTLVAPVIADEKQRKTLHYLLASRLTSSEIVLGKLMARLLNLGVFLGIALPIVSMLSLFGGVDPQLVLISFCGIASVALFVASLSIWVSTVAKKAREAILTTYLFVLAWLILPLMVESLQYIWPSGYAWFGGINKGVLATNPFVTALGMLARPSSTGSPDWSPLLYMVGVQLGASVVFIVLAVWRLRPIYQKQADAPKRVGWAARRRHFRLFQRPDCGDAPMIWKEMHLVRSAGMLRWLARFLALAGFLFMGYFLVYYTAPVFEEILVHGFVPPSDRWSKRQELNYCLRFCLTILYVISTLGAATTAAASVTTEREEDTWTSLTTTLLTGKEIMLAKMIGAVWSMRILYAVMSFLALLGLVTGAIHPLGLVAGLIDWTIFTWFAIILGLRFSLRSRNTTRATAGTVAVLIMLNAGYLMCCVPLRPDTTAVLLGCTPALVATSLLSYRDLWELLGWYYDFGINGNRENWGLFFANIFGVLAYGAGAVALTISVFKGFDRAIDRPERQLWTSPPPEKLKRAPGSSEL